MKKGIAFVLIALSSSIAFTQNVGIGTNVPKARLHISDSSVVFTAPPNPLVPAGNTPITGSGRRMMWYADKAAFRIGGVNDNSWDKDSVGDLSFAAGFNARAVGGVSISMGYNTRASGSISTSMGMGTNASGFTSTSMGDHTTASSDGSTSMGVGTTASGYASTSMGFNTIASTNYAISMGRETTASGAISTSMGWATVASGIGSTSMGERTIASGYYSTSIGSTTRAKAYGSFTSGVYNDDTDNPNSFSEAATDRIFQIGNGSSSGVRSNALTVLRNGNLGIGTTNPARPLSFPASIGEKILFYPGGVGEVGIGVYGNELRLHADNPGAKVSFGTQTNAGVFTEAGKFEINGVYALSVFGSIWANGTTYVSDERFKQNITAISSPLQKLLQLNGVEYEMKVDAFPKNNFMSGRQIGLLAQNVEKIIPEAVNELDGYKGVDYARLVPLLIEAIKELKNENNEQQKQIEELKKIAVTKK